jgi:anti-sigma factor RsiW
MKQVQEEELSALIDGELSPQRAEEVRLMVQADPALRAQFAVLGKFDAQLWRAGEDAAFSAEITFPTEPLVARPFPMWLLGIGVALALIVIRLLPKLLELPTLGVSLQLVAGTAILFFITKMTRELATSGNAAFETGISA